MQVNSLAANVLHSRAVNNLPSKGIISADRVKKDLTQILQENAAQLSENTAAQNRTSVDAVSPFFASSLPKANADGSYTIDGVSFSAQELQRCRAVMQEAVAGIETEGTVDYIHHAQMRIATQAVRTFAEESLNEAQADILLREMQDYCERILSNEEKILSDGSYISADTGEISAYYGVQKTYTDAEIQAINDLIDEMNRVSGSKKAHVGKEFTATVSSATNASVLRSMDTLFANLDVGDSMAVQQAMEQYKALVAPIYRANGIDDTHGALTRVLSKDVTKLTELIDNIAARGNHAVLDRNA